MRLDIKGVYLSSCSWFVLITSHHLLHSSQFPIWLKFLLLYMKNLLNIGTTTNDVYNNPSQIPLKPFCLPSSAYLFIEIFNDKVKKDIEIESNGTFFRTTLFTVTSFSMHTSTPIPNTKCCLNERNNIYNNKQYLHQYQITLPLISSII